MINGVYKKMKKKLLIVYTGGTIGMKKSPNGWIPASGFLKELMNENRVFRNEVMPDFDILELEPLLDSSDMSPDDWVKIAKVIEQHYTDYQGFVVLHGTDTMAYTASALSFMLEGLEKPVILTGSQIPMMLPRNDATENIIGAMLFAANHEIPEVCVFFDNILLRGCRTQKVNAEGFRAFESPNLPPLGIGGIHIKINRNIVFRSEMDTNGLTVQSQLDTRVGVLWLFPGITGEIVKNYLRPPIKGVVIQAFGSGNGPVSNQAFIQALAEANERGVVLVDCTQCTVGTVLLADYATGTGMARAGLVSGYDMTPEAALTKLAYLLGKGYSPEEVKQWMNTNMRGEMTVSMT